MSAAMVNNYFKTPRGDILAFNDMSDLSILRAMRVAVGLSNGAPLVVWKKYLGMPPGVRVVGDNRKPFAPALTIEEPHGGADDYPDDEDDDAPPKEGEAKHEA